KQLVPLQKRLERPKSKQECLVLNVYDEMVEYLDNRTFGDESMWQLLLETETQNPKKVRKDLIRHVHSHDFIKHINDKITDHLQLHAENTKSYVTMHVWGSIFPFVRAHIFLNKMEDKIKHDKMILMYPGYYKDKHYIMFGELESDTIYRGSCLNQLIGE